MDPVNTESKLRHKLKVSYWLMVINLIIFVPILRLSYLEANKNQEKIRHMSDQISRLTGKNEVCSKNEATRKKGKDFFDSISERTGELIEEGKEKYEEIKAAVKK